MLTLSNFGDQSFDFNNSYEVCDKLSDLYSILSPIRDLSWSLACLELD